MSENKYTIMDTGLKFGPNDFLNVNYQIAVRSSENARKIREAFENCISEVHMIWEEDQKIHEKSAGIDRSE